MDYEFNEAIADLNNGNFNVEDFFMIDFKQEEMRSAITLNSHYLGFQKCTSEHLKQEKESVLSALKRLDAY